MSFLHSRGDIVPVLINSLQTDSKVDEVVILDSRELSTILTYPLLIDKNLTEKSIISGN